MCKILIKLATSTVIVALAHSAHASEKLAGPARVIDGTTLYVAGKRILLDHITSPKPGTKCTWKNRPLDCGVLAGAGLKDLIVGSTVTCRKNPSGRYTCKAGGYDLAYGLIHAGWAVPTAGAPKYYFDKQIASRARKLGLWGARDEYGKTIALTLPGS